jgi:ABC-type polysaccharide/polyol phosphate transport system ATPase subunit
MKNDIAISIKNMSKDFIIYGDKVNTLKERIIRFNKNNKEVRNVLNDINIDIKRGETVALIGVNGSGKSTLLKLITRIIYPSKGNIKVNGKVSSLLELGAGFHPDFSGRENIYFNASIFGLTKKEIDDRLADIIKFSELEEFIDTPIRTYSSGMYMRLAFSVAINVDADIILIDEILAVGDQHFQEKCMDKMLELKKNGKTIVFVSHSASAVKFLCDRSIWLKDGKVVMDGKTNDVLDEYEKVCG